MVRNKVDACMFCDEIHSGPCGGKPVKKAAPKPRKVAPPKPKAVETPAPEPASPPAPGRLSPLAAMKQAAQQAQAPRTPETPVQVATIREAVKTQDDQHDEAELAAALLALDAHGMLHPLDRRKHDRLLRSKIGLNERRKAWRARVSSGG